MFENTYGFSIASDDFCERERCGNCIGINEDALCFGKDYLVVIDGATGLNEKQLMGKKTDAAWMAAQLADLLCRELDKGTKEPTADILQRCAAGIKSQLDAAGYDPGAGLYPSACVSAVRLIDGRLDCYALGDVTILLRRKDGEIVTVMDTAVPARDSVVIAWMAETASRLGITVLKARELATDMLLKNRSEMNTENGYWIFEPTGSGIGHAITASYDAADFTDVALMSDGFFDAFDLFRLEKLDGESFERLSGGRALELARKLRSKENADPDCNSYPRFKQADDATIVCARIRR